MRLFAGLLALSIALAGCGLGEGEERAGSGATLRVTRDFGHELLSERRTKSVREDETVMRLLRSVNEVETRFGGRFVQSIDGLSGRGPGGRSDWFFYVNGIEAGEGAAEFELFPGDVVHWDYRDWRATMDVRAIVGAFPAPFVQATEGKRRPVRVECQDAASDPCRNVKRALQNADVPATGASLGASGTRNVIRVVVAEWSRARELPSVRLIEQGPRRSGVFARYRDDGRRLELLDEEGRVARTEGPEVGLVAAISPREGELIWVVTGGDDSGLRRAAGSLSEEKLRDAFAVAAGPDDPEKLPVVEGSP